MDWQFGLKFCCWIWSGPNATLGPKTLVVGILILSFPLFKSWMLPLPWEMNSRGLSGLLRLFVVRFETAALATAHHAHCFPTNGSSSSLLCNTLYDSHRQQGSHFTDASSDPTSQVPQPTCSWKSKWVGEPDYDPTHKDTWTHWLWHISYGSFFFKQSCPKFFS